MCTLFVILQEIRAPTTKCASDFCFDGPAVFGAEKNSVECPVGQAIKAWHLERWKDDQTQYRYNVTCTGVKESQCMTLDTPFEDAGIYRSGFALHEAWSK